jgi:hypothetical protein
MLSSSPSSGPLVLQSRSHYPQRSPQNAHRSDVLKDVENLTQIDLDVWTALGIQGVVLDLVLLQALSPSEQQAWILAVRTIGITIFGLDRGDLRRDLQDQKAALKQTHCEDGFEFPVIQLNDRLLLTTLKDTTVCLSPQPDRVVFLGQSWSDRVVSWLLGCRFTAVQSPIGPAYQTAPLSDLQV